MSERRYRPIKLGETIETQGRLRSWVARRGGISEPMLSLAISGKRTINETAAIKIAEALQVPIFLIFEFAEANETFGSEIDEAIPA